MGDEIRDKNCLSSPTKWQHERWRCPQTLCFCNKSERGDALVSNTTWRSINQKPIHPFSSESCCHISSSERLHSEPLKIELSAFSFSFLCFQPQPGRRSQYWLLLEWKRINWRHKNKINDYCCAVRGFSAWFATLRRARYSVTCGYEMDEYSLLTVYGCQSFHEMI